jgi:hypothetical protein
VGLFPLLPAPLHEDRVDPKAPTKKSKRTNSERRSGIDASSE